MSLEFEFDEADEGEETPPGLPLRVETCAWCRGDVVVVAVSHRHGLWCGECRPAEVRFPARDPQLYPVLAGPGALYPMEPHGTRFEGGKPKPAPWTGVYPAPERTSREAWDGGALPSVVAKLAERACGASWTVGVQRSRGSVPHAAHGRPGAVKTLSAVTGRKGARCFYAVHDGGKWSSIMVWSDVIPWFPSCTVTDLDQWIRGDIGDRGWPAWIGDIRARTAESLAAKKQREACHRGDHKEVADATHTWCTVCSEKPWRTGESAPRRGVRPARYMEAM